MEKLQHRYLEVKNDSPISYDFHDDEFASFEKHTIGIGSKLLKKMGYQGKGLGIKGEGIINPIKAEEFPCRAGLGYAKKEMGESSNTTSNQKTTDDEIPLSKSSFGEGPMNTYQRNTRGKHPKAAPKVWRKKIVVVIATKRETNKPHVQCSMLWKYR